MNISVLRDERAAVAKEMLNLVDNHPGKLWTSEQTRIYDSKVDRLYRLDSEINRIDNVQRRNRDFAIDDEASVLFSTYVRRGEQGLTPEQIRNTMSTTTGSQGGFSVSSNVAARFTGVEKDSSAVRRVAEVITTDVGGPLGWPISDDTATVGERLAENVTATAADPSFATAPLQAWKYSSKLITVPYELLQDSNIDMESFLINRAAGRIGRIQNTDFTLGNGTGQPTGFAPGATVGKTGTTGQTTSIIYDDLIDLIGSVDPAYRVKPGTGFMLSDSAWKIIRKIKDTTNARPVFLPADGIQPETLLGYPVYVNNDVAVMAANARSVFFGNWFSAFKIVDALQITLLRMDGSNDSALTKLGQVGFLFIQRSGGALVDSKAIAAYVNSAT